MQHCAQVITAHARIVLPSETVVCCRSNPAAMQGINRMCACSVDSACHALARDTGPRSRRHSTMLSVCGVHGYQSMDVVQVLVISSCPIHFHLAHMLGSSTNYVTYNTQHMPTKA